MLKRIEAVHSDIALRCYPKEYTPSITVRTRPNSLKAWWVSGGFFFLWCKWLSTPFSFSSWTKYHSSKVLLVKVILSFVYACSISILCVCILIPEDSTIGSAFLVLLNPNKKKKGTLQPQVIKVEKVSGTEEGQVKQESNEDKAIVLTL